MTKQQLDDANALVKRIERLRSLYSRFSIDAVNFDESLVRMTSYDIVSDSKDLKFNLNQSEILFLIEALNNEIIILEAELAKI